MGAPPLFGISKRTQLQPGHLFVRGTARMSTLRPSVPVDASFSALQERDAQYTQLLP